MRPNFETEFSTSALLAFSIWWPELPLLLTAAALQRANYGRDNEVTRMLLKSCPPRVPPPSRRAAKYPQSCQTVGECCSGSRDSVRSSLAFEGPILTDRGQMLAEIGWLGEFGPKQLTFGQRRPLSVKVGQELAKLRPKQA